MVGVKIKKVEADENGMRLDRWFKVYYPDVGFGYLQKLLRSGQIRVDGGRVKNDVRLVMGQSIRVPPLLIDKEDSFPVINKIVCGQDNDIILKDMLLYEDSKIFVFNKPAGLAVQGGSGLTRHVDSMLEVWRNKKGEKPRLVHRIDRETSGVLVVARSRGAAQALTAAFRTRETKKTYWALVRGVPRKKQDKISTWMVREITAQGDKMRVCERRQPDSNHAVSYYRVLDTRGKALSWLEMEPYTGRTHQLRVHAAYINHPIIGDSKYFFSDSNWDLPGGMQNRLHLHARRIRIPHPSGGILDVTAPLPPHMVQSFNLFAFNEIDGDTE
ncbi:MULTISPECIES: RluA family pseudouridine synthase [Bartonella]|uniref:Pseudouridine synthase n=1 Tax=Bartonella rochalimae ATCC BAA-1498 TaxID=685782 RepID=E6YM94_9HYPH|nr:MULTISPECIES: RluA family pseudouridine synthase [Bartonella]AQX18211.1 ribosomal large subunit pseudouridine synthase C [Bartonella sp. A1379B]AQX22726.1 23S rRNA pseudouridine 955/2504/2580 synthase [Bartonella sp. 11B]AQX23989.1 23S rRNA pseudouridine 955/2504/2580 synthase [Bartonella sp. 114]AQX25175.1 ribosomal large subunit pseudouridine synthase C [Bartonella sp. Coyote22sub2]KEC56970.1 RluA family pseudouridine synthase [Bartonella rochalimae ATCC BAA-1498]